LDALYVDETYASQMLGSPKAERNDALLGEITGRTARIWPDVPVHVLDTWFAEKPLPPVTLAGQFTSFSPARDSAKHASCLVIVWFQEAYQPGMSEENEAGIKAIAWTDHAKDFEW
jgi:hypothetical protein